MGRPANRSGFSFIELVVVGAAMGLLTIGFSQALISWKRNEGNLYENMEIESHRRWVRLGFDCAETMENVTGACTTSPVPIYRANGSTLIQSPSTTVGSYEFRGLCSGNTQKSFTVETRKVGSANWGPLFPVNIPRVCNEAVANHGTILIAGYNGSTTSLVKIDSGGNRDDSYGTAGVYDLPAGIPVALGMHVLPSKKILLVSGGTFARLNADATLDTSYGTGGVVSLPFVPGRRRSFLLGNRIYINSTTGANQCIMGIEAFDLNGNPIAGFGTSGYKRLKGPPVGTVCPNQPGIQTVSCLGASFLHNISEHITLDSTGKVLVSGTGSVMRLNATNGALDTSFGGASTGACAGVAWGMTITYGGATYYQNRFHQAYVKPDGRIWLAYGQPTYMLTQELTASGVLDTAYGSMVVPVGFPPVPTTYNGMKSEAANFPNSFVEMFHLASGQILVWGGSTYTHRLNSNLTQDTTYNSTTSGPPGYASFFPMVPTQSGHMIGWAYRVPITCEIGRLRTDGSYDASFPIRDHGCGQPALGYNGMGLAVELPP